MIDDTAAHQHADTTVDRTEQENLFPGVPSIESPIFKSWLTHADLSPAEQVVATSLNRHGFAVIDFPDPQLDARIIRIREKLTPMLGMGEDTESANFAPSGARVQDAWIDNEDVRAIAANRQLIDLLSKLWGRTAFPFQTLNFPVGTEQQLHTDTVHFSSLPERFMCGVWLAMEDVAPEAGPLQYVPGSHKWPVVSNMMIGRSGWQQALESAQSPFERAWTAMVSENGLSPEAFLPRKGQALIWCANLLHGGSPRTEPRCTRWSQVTHYYFENCIYYTPAFSDEPLGKLQLRHIVDATDGTPKPNHYLGEEIETVKPLARRSLWGRIASQVLKGSK